MCLGTYQVISDLLLTSVTCLWVIFYLPLSANVYCSNICVQISFAERVMTVTLIVFISILWVLAKQTLHFTSFLSLILFRFNQFWTSYTRHSTLCCVSNQKEIYFHFIGSFKWKILCIRYRQNQLQPLGFI